jgi:enoyl-[acyl-carrier protein] reductase III
MTIPPSMPIPALSGWALILGASSGFGEAVGSFLARAGCHIIGVHLDRRATLGNVERIQNEIKAFGREAWFFNINAADESKRREVCDEIQRRFRERGKNESLRILLHSLAFGSLKPFFADTVDGELNQKQIEMTNDVMAHSLVYWTQDLLHRKLIGPEGRIFAMTSTGSWAVWKGYGAVSSAKAALEAHVRQLAVALRKIPENDAMVQVALRKNPWHRLTKPEDVAAAIVALAQPCTYWINGNVINVDGGEAASG